MEDRSVEPVLLDYSYLAYGYECNSKSKFGNSFVNINGKKPKTHRTSVPALAVGYLIYVSKEHLQELNCVIKNRYQTTNRKTEHALCRRIKNFCLWLHGFNAVSVCKRRYTPAKIAYYLFEITYLLKVQI